MLDAHPDKNSRMGTNKSLNFLIGYIFYFNTLGNADRDFFVYAHVLQLA